MQSINNLIVSSEGVGRYAVELAHGLREGVAVAPGSNADNPWNRHRPLGARCLPSPRGRGNKSVVKGYQADYIARAQELENHHARAGRAQSLCSCASCQQRPLQHARQRHSNRLVLATSVLDALQELEELAESTDQ